MLDLTGMAQKYGAVMSHVLFAKPRALPSCASAGRADAVLGCDIVVTAGSDAIGRMAGNRTRVVANVATTPTADFTRNADLSFPLDAMSATIVEAVGEANAAFVDASRLATALMGDAIATNLFMLGYAWQKGMIPLSAAAIERAIELNQVAVQSNKTAFAWGRLARRHRGGGAATPTLRSVPMAHGVPRGHRGPRVEFLVAYQSRRYARRYTALVDAGRAAEAAPAAARAGSRWRWRAISSS